jgi:hypothetical protein
MHTECGRESGEGENKTADLSYAIMEGGGSAATPFVAESADDLRIWCRSDEKTEESFLFGTKFVTTFQGCPITISYPGNVGEQQIEITCSRCGKSTSAKVVVTDKKERVLTNRVGWGVVGGVFTILVGVIPFFLGLFGTGSADPVNQIAPGGRISMVLIAIFPIGLMIIMLVQAAILVESTPSLRGGR